MKNRKVFFVTCLFIFIFAFLLSLHRLEYESFNFDEAYSLFKTGYSYKELITGGNGAYDPGNPPMYFILLKTWANVLGSNDFSYRLFSVLVFSLSCVLFYWIVNILTSNFQASLFTAIYTLSATNIYYAQTVRSYSLLVFICLLVFLTVLKVLRDEKWAKEFLVIFAGIGLYTHYSFLIYYAFIITIFTIFYPQKRKVFFKSFLYSLIFFIPWIAIFITKPAFNLDLKYHFFQLNIPWTGVDRWVSIFLNLDYLNIVILLKLSVLIIFLGVFYFKYKLINKEQKTLSYIFLLMTSLLFFTPINHILNNERYMLFLIPLFLLWCSVLFSFFGKKIQFVIFAIWIFFSINNVSNAFNIKDNEDWKTLVSDIESSDIDKVLFIQCHLRLAYEHYAKDHKPLWCAKGAFPLLGYREIWSDSGEKKIAVVEYSWIHERDPDFEVKLSYNFQKLAEHIYTDIKVTRYIRKG